MLYPAKDLIFFQADIHGNQLVQERIKTLQQSRGGQACHHCHHLCGTDDTAGIVGGEKTSSAPSGAAVWTRADWHPDWWLWDKVYQVESPGQFSIRGGIVDIFDLTERTPIVSNCGEMKWNPSAASIS